MKPKTLLLTLVIVLLALGAWNLGWPIGGTTESIEPEIDVVQAQTDDDPELVLDPDPDENAAEEQRTAADAEVDVPETGDPVLPRSRVFGTITNTDGAPLAGFPVRMSSVGEAWTSAAKTKGSHRTNTDALGAFEFDVPTPTSSWISLYLKGDPMYSIDGRDFGPAGGRDQEPLIEGDNDLGTFVLTATGTISGTVLDAEGLALKHATVSLDGSFPGGYSINDISEDDGTFLLGHVPTGTYAVQARSKGLSTERVTGVAVEEGRRTEQVNFVLQRASTIRGRVVDEEQQPVSGADVTGYVEGGGRMCYATTGDDGSFVLALTEAKPHSLTVEKSGYEHTGRMHGDGHEPGAEDVLITLQSMGTTEFHVVDAATDEPIPSFGLRVIQVRTKNGTTSSSAHDDPARVKDHPGGIVSIPCDPKLHDYTIVAPGYGPQRGRVKHDDGVGSRHTIRLFPAGSITGRSFQGGVPQTRATIRFHRDRFPKDPNNTEGEHDFFSDTWTTDLDAFAGRKQRAKTDETGTFLIPDLAPGTYELILTARNAAPLTIERIAVVSGAVTDLGNVEPEAPARIQGMLLTLPGHSPAGVKVAPGSQWFGDDERAVTTGPDGRFEFGDLAAGEHRLWILPQEGKILEGEAFVVNVAAGETKELTLDIASRVPAKIEVVVRINGALISGLIVVEADGNNGRAGRLGTTSADGTAKLQLPGSPEVGLVIQNAYKMHIGAAPDRFLPRDEHGGRIEIELEAGRLTVTMPTAPPQDGANTPLIIDREGRERSQVVMVPQADWTQVGDVWQVDLGPVTPDQYTIRKTAGQPDLHAEVDVPAGESVTANLVE